MPPENSPAQRKVPEPRSAGEGVNQGGAHGPAAGAAGAATRIGSLVVRVLLVLLALGWASGNLRPVPPGSQAVVLRFGRVAGVQQSGLVLALPWPFEQVVWLPNAERELVLKVAASPARIAGIAGNAPNGGNLPADAGLYLTGDGGVVVLDAAIYWRVADPASYYVARDHVLAALRRIFLGAGVTVAASRPLDDFLAARSERAADPSAQEARSAVRGDLVAAMNAQLATLTHAGAGLGVEVTRADVTALLPQSAISRFDAVLDATQRAEQNLAAARTDAARVRQQADQTKDSLLSAAHASAAERVARARARTAEIVALEVRMDPAGRPSMLDQLYRDRIGPILGQAGSVSTVDAKSVSRLILPGAQ